MPYFPPDPILGVVPLQIDTGFTAFTRSNISPDLTLVEHDSSCVYDPADRCIDSVNGLKQREPRDIGSLHGIMGF